MGGVCFVQRTNVFVSVYHSKERKLYTFTYSFLHKKILSDIRTIEMSPNLKLNFPIKTLWDEQRNLAFTFFR